MTIRDRLDRARQLDFVRVDELALLTGMSARTIWRRLAVGLFPHVLHSGRITRIHRLSALRVLAARRPMADLKDTPLITVEQTGAGVSRTSSGGSF